MEAIIRRAVPTDAPALSRLLSQILGVHHEGRPDLFRDRGQKYSLSELRAIVTDPTTPVWVAEAEGEVVAYCFCQIKRVRAHPILKNRVSLHVDDLCVDKACRGRGLGTALYHRVAEFAKAEGCADVTLQVWECNPEAMAFYQKLGFVPQRTVMERPVEGGAQ